MKVLGIVCEFNPFHNGHKYLIDTVKEKTGADLVIAIMSGNFTQQGNISIYDKFTRADIATSINVDIVIELPVVFSISSAEYFCRKAVSILSSLNCLDYIAFGSESGDIDLLSNIANKIIKNESQIWERIKKLLKTGISFARAREISLEPFLSENELNEISKSNNILAIEYIKTLIKINSNIEPITIKRLGNDYNLTTLSKSNLSSATAIRNYIYSNPNNISAIKDSMPILSYNAIKEKTPVNNDDIFYMIKYKILNSSTEGLKKINQIGEGIENKIVNEIVSASSYLDFVSKIKSKRYQESRIKRMLLNILLNVTNEDFKEMESLNNFYAHILSVSNKGKSYLSTLCKNSNSAIIIKKKDFDDIKNTTLKKMLSYDLLASNLYSSISSQRLNEDFLNKI